MKPSTVSDNAPIQSEMCLLHLTPDKVSMRPSAMGHTRWTPVNLDAHVSPSYALLPHVANGTRASRSAQCPTQAAFKRTRSPAPHQMPTQGDALGRASSEPYKTTLYLSELGAVGQAGRLECQVYPLRPYLCTSRCRRSGQTAHDILTCACCSTRRVDDFGILATAMQIGCCLGLGASWNDIGTLEQHIPDGLVSFDFLYRDVRRSEKSYVRGARQHCLASPSDAQTAPQLVYRWRPPSLQTWQACWTAADGAGAVCCVNPKQCARSCHVVADRTVASQQHALKIGWQHLNTKTGAR